MVKNNIWDKLSAKYDKLWVQKYSLTPTRQKILGLINKENFSLLDIGCATGQLLCELVIKYPKSNLFGIDKSQEMIKIAKGKKLNIDFRCITAEENHFTQKFDYITCCHSFPYYDDKRIVLKKICEILADDGKAIFIQASINSKYDKFVMNIIEKTAEKAEYLSVKEFEDLAGEFFKIEKVFKIKEKCFMPSICGFVMRKRI
jgi:2-polyprenyl-3-methyl-5-hydroxy-6-metoxy-1,4-benzoquinol methylase